MPKFGPDKASDKHANAKDTGLWSGDESAAPTCMSRRSFLDGTHRTSFYKGQSLEILKGAGLPGSDVLLPGDPGYSPTDWPAAGRLLRVPKCVVLSSLYQWSLLWNSTFFAFPSDVVGLAQGLLTNYYYLEQWDNVGHVPNEQGYQTVGVIASNPWREEQAQVMAAFRQAKTTLESDPDDPIAVIIAPWVPSPLETVAPVSHPLNHWSYTPDRQWYQNSIPMQVTTPNPYEVTYPDEGNPDNYADFSMDAGVPCLLSAGLGFGTNVLHLYAGHWARRAQEGDAPWSLESWPLLPEGIWFGPEFLTDYLGNVNPFFAGRRARWTDPGLNYGYTNGSEGQYTSDPVASAKILYHSQFEGLCRGSSSAYTDNAYKHRDFVTKIYGTEVRPEVSWDVNVLYNDQFTTTGVGFWFGYDTFEDFLARPSGANAPDDYSVDMSQSPQAGPSHIKIYEHFVTQPSTQAIDDAIRIVYPPLKRRVEDYYRGIGPGTKAFFAEMLADIANPRITYEGAASTLTDAGAIVDIVRKHSRDHPS